MCNPRRIRRFVMENDRSIGRSRLAEQKRDGRDRWRADRSAWRHRAEARRVKAGRSVSRLSDAIMPLATTVRNVSVAPRHTSFAFCTTSPFAHTARHASAVVRAHTKGMKRRMIISRETQKCGYSVDTPYGIYLNRPASITSRVWPGSVPKPCVTKWKDRKWYAPLAVIFVTARRESDGKCVIDHEEKAPRKMCMCLSVCVCVCSRRNTRVDEFEQFGDRYLKIAPKSRKRVPPDHARQIAKKSNGGFWNLKSALAKTSHECCKGVVIEMSLPHR